jgi:hypothetical protein
MTSAPAFDLPGDAGALHLTCCAPLTHLAYFPHLPAMNAYLHTYI